MVNHYLLCFIFMALNNVELSRAEDAAGWIGEVFSFSRLLFGGCGTGKSVFHCVQTRMLRGLDRLVDQDVLRLPYGIKLVQDKSSQGNLTEVQEVSKRHSASLDTNFADAVLSRALRLIHTHSVHIPLSTNNVGDVFEGRRRHHNRNRGDMMGIMLFGVMAMTVIAIPLGFQFLAVLGGKALMLAKLALILTSIQGLKKIATSHLNYGLYHSSHHHRPWHYDRRWQPNSLGEPETGLFDNFDLSQPEAGQLDTIRPRIMIPRPGYHGNGVFQQPPPE